MNKEELKSWLSSNFPSCQLEETKDFVVLRVNKNDILEAGRKLKDNKETRFDYLFCETAVDLKTCFEVLYHLSSNTYRHNLLVKVTLEDRNTPELNSVYSVWKGADLYECEIYDLMGVRFLNHPNLRRLFLGEEWIGYPLRKDYKDDVNVISL
jgi:NADH-quinone oxidoreductase subunit C